MGWRVWRRSLGSRSNSLPDECFAFRPYRHESRYASSFRSSSRRAKKLTVDFEGGNQSSDGGLLLLREAERGLRICERLAGSMRDLRDASRVQHSLVELIKTRVFAICCGYEDGNDLDRLKDDPLLKMAVGHAPESGAALCSRSTMSRLENMPSPTEAVRLTAALIDQFCASFATPPAEITLDIDDTLDEVHGGQQLSFWNAHHVLAKPSSAWTRVAICRCTSIMSRAANR